MDSKREIGSQIVNPDLFGVWGSDTITPPTDVCRYCVTNTANTIFGVYGSVRLLPLDEFHLGLTVMFLVDSLCTSCLNK
jgi:hypothetical protein